MVDPNCERLDGTASRIYLSPPPTDTESCAANVSLSIRVLPNFSVFLV